MIVDNIDLVDDLRISHRTADLNGRNYREIQFITILHRQKLESDIHV